MTRLEIAAGIIAGWAANPNVSGKNEEAAAVSLALADALLDAAETPAPKVAPVRFDGAGRAGDWVRDGWDALHRGDELRVTLDLRPGKDAGDLTARMLASVGRWP